MPRILLRHIVADLLRILLLTASVLVAVIAFGAAIRPIMQNLLGAEDLIPFVTQASIPMLQFALPFAGAFAGTIVYARLAAENETIAMSVAGLSYRQILMPAVVLGVALFLAMAVLVDAAVPRFWTSMQRLLTRDVTRLFVAAVERHEALVIGDTQLYADDAVVTPGDPNGPGPVTRLTLAGVAAVELGDDGRPSSEFTAEYATVDVYRNDDSSYIKLLFTNATAYDSDEGALVYVPQAEPEAIDLGRGIKLKPKDLDLRGLLAVWSDVEHYHGVAEPRRRAIAALSALDSWNCIVQRLAADGTVRMVDSNGRRTFEVRNARIEGEKLLPRQGDTLELAELERGSAGRRAFVREAQLRREQRTRGSDTVFELVTAAKDVVEGANSHGRWPPKISGIRPSACTPKDRSAASVAEIGAEARSQAAAGAGATIAQARTAAANAAHDMDESVRLVRADIVARIVQRINQSLCAPLILLLGATLAIRLRGANPLQVYLLAFVPSIADILLISGGEQMLRDGTSVLGIFVATSGNLAVAAITFIAYRQVARN